MFLLRKWGTFIVALGRNRLKWAYLVQNGQIWEFFPKKYFAPFLKRTKNMFLWWKLRTFIEAFRRNSSKQAFLAKNGQFWPFWPKKGQFWIFVKKTKSSLFKFSECTASCKKTEQIIAQFRRKMGYARTDAQTDVNS